MAADRIGEYRAALAMRGLLLWYTKGLPYSSRFRGGITRIRDLESLIVAMDDYFGFLAREEPEGLSLSQPFGSKDPREG